jgi:Sugar-transfer associated ATP-grasp
MPLNASQKITQKLGTTKKWLLGHAEYWLYDLVGLPMALRYGWQVHKAAPEKFLHRYFAKMFWRWPLGLPRALLTALVWPMALLAAIIIFTRWNGKGIKAQRGIGFTRQIYGQLKMAICHSIAPFWFYVFELYDPARAKRAKLYLTAHETVGAAFEDLQPKTEQDKMADKVWFAAHCRSMNVRAVPVFLYLSGGAILPALSENTELPDVDLFVKPRQGNGGHSAERYDFEYGTYRNSVGLRFTKQELLDWLLQQSLKDDFIVQPRLVNHPALADISNDALSTVRVLTCRNEKGEPEATNVAFRMAVGGNTIVDNFHQGGLAAAVNMHTGAIGEASDIGMTPQMGWREVHPVSGIRFRDRVLPDWRKVLALAVDAHKAFPARVIVGWDVAMLIDGPMIIEGNGKPDLDIHQRVERRPLGDQRIAELVMFNLQKMQSQL